MTPGEGESQPSDKAGLSARRAVENTEYAGFVRRALAAYGRRVGVGDLEDLRDLVALRDELERMIARTVRAVHSGDDNNPGYSWTEIAAVLGVSRQAARQRYHTGPGADAP